MLQKRSTRLVRATAILHKEYHAAYFFWEPIFLLQRLLISGFLQWIPSEYSLIRLQARNPTQRVPMTPSPPYHPLTRLTHDSHSSGCRRAKSSP